MYIFQPDVHRSQYKYTDDTDLWFALRGAGSSFGIPTCFFSAEEEKLQMQNILKEFLLGFHKNFLQILTSSKWTKIQISDHINFLFYLNGQ